MWTWQLNKEISHLLHVKMLLELRELPGEFLRIISSTEQKEENEGGEGKLKMIREYWQMIGAKLICCDILDVLNKPLIPAGNTGKSKISYYKMKGDYHRYLAEFASGNEKKEATENNLVALKLLVILQ